MNNNNTEPVIAEETVKEALRDKKTKLTDKQKKQIARIKDLKVVSSTESGKRWIFKAPKYNAPNALCECGSGKKYKKCHGITGF